MTDDLYSVKQDSLEVIDDALGRLSSAEFLIFIGWLEGVAHKEQMVAVMIREEKK